MLMVMNILGNGLMVENKAKEFIIMLMEIIMMDNGLKMKLKALQLL
jgi:hypothetical protein